MADELAPVRDLEHSHTTYVYAQRYLLMLNALLCQHSSNYIKNAMWPLSRRLDHEMVFFAFFRARTSVARPGRPGSE